MENALQKLINQFMPFAQKHIGFEHPPKLFLKQDQENANNPLGKTAFYDPEAKSVTLYITNRHPKDILRSLGHELVHHKQNCNGEFEDAGDMGEGYAQNNPFLRTKEEEANRDGSMCLRDFEDLLKKENTIYYEHLQKGDKKMSTKDWKNEEIRTLLAEAWGFKFNTLQEFEEFDGPGDVQVEAEEESADVTEEAVADAADGDVQEEAAAAETDIDVQEEATADTADADVQEEAYADADDDETLEEADSENLEEENSDEATTEAVEINDDLKEAIVTLLRKHLRG